MFWLFPSTLTLCRSLEGLFSVPRAGDGAALYLALLKILTKIHQCFLSRKVLTPRSESPATLCCWVCVIAATEYHLGLLKAKLAKYRAQLLEPSKSPAAKGEGFDVMKSGDARVALIGFPSVGKVSQGLCSLCLQLTGVCRGCRAGWGSQVEWFELGGTFRVLWWDPTWNPVHGSGVSSMRRMWECWREHWGVETG